MEELLRLDVYIHKKGLIETREKAKKLIYDESVYVNDELITKPSYKVSDLDVIKITKKDSFVGRGALKLEKALDSFNICVEGMVAADIGASTGGFTDLLIKKNAKKIYAIDVGHDQLHESLRNNEKVINLEGVNFRNVNKNIFKDDIDLFTVDVSFISLKFIIPKIVENSNIKTKIVALIKPQFEAGKNNVRKNGLVKDKKVHKDVLTNFIEDCKKNGVHVVDIIPSPIRGGDGNIEYLSYLKIGSFNNEINIQKVIENAFKY